MEAATDFYQRFETSQLRCLTDVVAQVFLKVSTMNRPKYSVCGCGS